MDLDRVMSQVQQAQAELAKVEASFSANGLTVVATGDLQIKSVSIDPDVIENGEKERLEDVVLVAVNGALDKARGEVQNQASGLAAGFGLGDLFGQH